MESPVSTGLIPQPTRLFPPKLQDTPQARSRTCTPAPASKSIWTPPCGPHVTWRTTPGIPPRQHFRSSLARIARTSSISESSCADCSRSGAPQATKSSAPGRRRRLFRWRSIFWATEFSPGDLASGQAAFAGRTSLVAEAGMLPVEVGAGLARDRRSARGADVRCRGAFALANHEEFLEEESDREKLMDRLHAYCYFLEALLFTAEPRGTGFRNQTCGAALAGDRPVVRALRRECATPAGPAGRASSGYRSAG